MAMITCPNCGEQVSDKAKKCVHCGVELILINKKQCSECGTYFEGNATECPKCGCPADEAKSPFDQQPQMVEVTGVKVTKKTKSIIGIIVILLLVVGLISFGANQYQKKKEAEAYAQRVEEYASNLKLATFEMLSGASDAESCGNLIKKVWSNAIEKEHDYETDKYTMKDREFVSDFNDALGNLYADENFKNQINNIKENQSTVNAYMKDLKNPPEEYKDAYEAISDLFDAYLIITNLATNPSGSLITFSNNFNDADTKVLNCYNAMSLYFDE